MFLSREKAHGTVVPWAFFCGGEGASGKECQLRWGGKWARVGDFCPATVSRSACTVVGLETDP